MRGQRKKQELRRSVRGVVLRKEHCIFWHARAHDLGGVRVVRANLLSWLIEGEVNGLAWHGVGCSVG